MEWGKSELNILFETYARSRNFKNFVASQIKSVLSNTIWGLETMEKPKVKFHLT